MRNLGVLILSLLIAAVASAQKVYFLYLQSENATSFYVKMDDKIQTAASGYLILPQLKDSTYTLAIGSSAMAGELKFSIRIMARDQGFLIKKFDYGFALFNLQSLNVIRPNPEPSGSGGTSVRKAEDEFTSLLSRAANDTTLLYTTVFEPPKASPINDQQPVAIIETNRGNEALPDSNKKEVGATHNTQTTEISSGSVQVKYSADSTAVVIDTLLKSTVDRARIDSIFRQEDSLATTSNPTMDSRLAGRDSVNHSTVQLADIKSSVDTVAIMRDSSAAASVQATPNQEGRYEKSVVKKHAESSTSEGFGLVFYDALNGVTDTIRLVIPNPRLSLQGNRAIDDTSGMLQRTYTQDQQGGQKLTAAKNNCKAQAVHTDFLKLRRDMASKESEEDMLTVARKGFRNKCFTTQQVKNLSNLFLTQAGKYNFFDLAFSHTSDPQQFPTLEGELVDNYYSGKFRTLIGQ